MNKYRSASISEPYFGSLLHKEHFGVLDLPECNFPPNEKVARPEGVEAILLVMQVSGK
jgi:hypothetical protein